MPRSTLICLAGYAIAQALICEWMDAGVIEHVFGFVGMVPVSLYCSYKDELEKHQ